MTKLRPCPFCGIEMTVESAIGDDLQIYVGCTCGAKMTGRDAERRWNNRPIEDRFAREAKR